MERRADEPPQTILARIDEWTLKNESRIIIWTSILGLIVSILHLFLSHRSK